MNLEKAKPLLILLIIFLIFFGLNKLGIGKIRNTVFLFSAPVGEAFWQAGEKVSSSFGALFEIESLKKRNQELEKINLKLQHQVIAFREVAGENEALREALNLGLEKDFTLSLAKVISRATEGDFILINQGKEDGVLQGMPVITSERILLGKVGEVFDDFSEVILISNGNATFDIEVLMENEKVLGLAEGKGGFRVRFQFIPKEAQIKEGNVVVSSRLGGDFPQGLLVGIVSSFKRNDAEPFLTGEIKPFFPELDFTNLFIIRKF